MKLAIASIGALVVLTGCLTFLLPEKTKSEGGDQEAWREYNLMKAEKLKRTIEAAYENQVVAFDPEQEERIEFIRRESGQDCLDLNGTHPMIVSFLKRSLADPESFEMIDTKFTKLGPHRVSQLTTYRSKNSLGAYEVNEVSAQFRPLDCALRAFKADPDFSKMFLQFH